MTNDFMPVILFNYGKNNEIDRMHNNIKRQFASFFLFSQRTKVRKSVEIL